MRSFLPRVIPGQCITGRIPFALCAQSGHIQSPYSWSGPPDREVSVQGLQRPQQGKTDDSSDRWVYPQVQSAYPAQRICEDAALRHPGQLGPQKTDQRYFAKDAMHWACRNATATSSANGKNTLPVADAGKVRHRCKPLPKMRTGTAGADRKGVSRQPGKSVCLY